MFSIFAAIASTTLFSGVALFWKRLRDKNVGPLATLGLGAICIPIYVVFGIILDHLGYAPTFSSPYFLVLALWIIGAFAINWTGTYLYKYRTLTELRTYQTSIAILVAVIVDSIFFKSTASVWNIIATIILFAGGLVLSGNVSYKAIRNTLTLGGAVIPILTFNAFLQVANIAIYKLAIAYQSQPLYQAVIGESLLYFLFFVVSFRDIRLGTSTGKISFKEITIIGSLLFVGTIFEIYMIKSFSVSLNIVLSVIPIAIYSLYDFKVKNLKLSIQSISALVLVIIGLGLSKL